MIRASFAGSPKTLAFAAIPPSPPPSDQGKDDLLTVEDRFRLESFRRVLPLLSRADLEDRFMDLLTLMARKDQLLKKMGFTMKPRFSGWDRKE